MIRKGKNVYSKKYDEAIEMHDKGIAINDIAKKLNISYSAVYNWVTGKRKPLKGQMNNFFEFLQKNGPTPVILLKELFPSHDDFYKSLRKRGFSIKRYKTSQKNVLGELSLWYYLDGQEDELKKRIVEMLEKYKMLRDRLKGNKAL